MRVMRLKERYPTAKVELWCEDEHRLGLKPLVRKAWSAVGERPRVRVHQRYEWTYLYAFARPEDGQVHWLILPTVNAEVFSVALEHFAREVGAGTRKRILLVLDNAGWHTAKRKLRIPEGDTPGVLALPFPGIATRREALGALGRSGGQPPLRGDRGTAGGAGGPMRDSTRAARAHPFVHSLSLVAGGSVRSKAIQTDLVLFG
jgi:hypothetical protein